MEEHLQSNCLGWCKGHIRAFPECRQQVGGIATEVQTYASEQLRQLPRLADSLPCRQSPRCIDIGKVRRHIRQPRSHVTCDAGRRRRRRGWSGAVERWRQAQVALPAQGHGGVAGGLLRLHVATGPHGFGDDRVLHPEVPHRGIQDQGHHEQHAELCRGRGIPIGIAGRPALHPSLPQVTPGEGDWEGEDVDADTKVVPEDMLEALLDHSGPLRATLRPPRPCSATHFLLACLLQRPLLQLPPELVLDIGREDEVEPSHGELHIEPIDNAHLLAVILRRQDARSEGVGLRESSRASPDHGSRERCGREDVGA
mmetsp:Transcript_93236/g.200069  ORF Transcript_93236/g.200069 Transcript_93236/m.200069 type:complete len:312 (-) Transcript_93236:222-1157(-)